MVWSSGWEYVVVGNVTETTITAARLAKTFRVRLIRTSGPQKPKQVAIHLIR